MIDFILASIILIGVVMYSKMEVVYIIPAIAIAAILAALPTGFVVALTLSVVIGSVLVAILMTVIKSFTDGSIGKSV